MKAKKITPEDRFISLPCKLLTFLSFIIVMNSYAQDSCTAKAYFKAVRSSSDYKSYTITNYSTGSNLSYFWHFGDGTTSASSNPGTHVYTTNSLHIIHLMVTDTVKHCTSGYSDTLRVPCSADFNFSTNGHDVVFVPSSVEDSLNLYFLWEFGDGSTSTLVSPLHHYTNTGSYYPCLRVTNKLDTTCTERICGFVKVEDAVPCKASFTAFQSPSNTATVSFTNTSTGNNLTYLWNFGDGQTSTLNSPTHTYTTNTNHVVCLYISSGTCSSSYCDTIFEANCSAQFTAYRLHGFVYQFNAKPNFNATFNWNFGDGTTAQTVVPYTTHSFPDNQFYNVCLTIQSTVDSSCFDTYCLGVNVNVENCHAAYSIAKDTSTPDPYDLVIYESSTGSNLSYFWEFGDGATSNLKNPTHDYAGDGPYILCLTVSNDSCKNVYCDTVYFPNIPKPEGTSSGKWHVKVVSKTISGINTNPSEKISLQNYPNPFNGTTTISYGISSSSMVELSVYNLLGTRVALIETATKAAGNYSLEWDAKNLPKGVYLLQLKTASQILTRKVIINE